MTKVITTKRNRKKARIRSKVSGTAERPRFAIFKSNKALYGQIIDDTKGLTIASVRDVESKAKTLRERAKEAGKIIAEKAKAKGVNAVVFDRGGFAFIGIVKEIAEGAREAGLNF